MKLITEDLEQRFHHLGNQEMKIDPLVAAKFIKDNTSYYAISFDPDENKVLCYISGSEDVSKPKWISVEELESKPIFGKSTVRDEFFTECNYSNLEIEPKKDYLEELYVNIMGDSLNKEEEFSHDNLEQEDELDMSR